MESIGNEIKKLMIDKKINQKDLIKKLEISRPALSKKLNGDREFNRREISKLIKIFGLTNQQAMTIFFTDKVS